MIFTKLSNPQLFHVEGSHLRLRLPCRRSLAVAEKLLHLRSILIGSFRRILFHIG